MSKQLQIIILFLCLNALLFLPRYLFDVGNSAFFPLTGFLEGSLYSRMRYLFNRRNFDIFRLSIDYLAVFGGGVLISSRWKIKAIHWLIAGFYILIFLYQLYFACFEGLYRTNPLFYNDLGSLVTAAGIMWDSLGIWLIFAIIGALLILTFLFLLNLKFSKLASQITFGKYSRLLIGGLVLLCLVSIIRYKRTFRSTQAFQLQMISIVSNIRTSQEASKFMRSFDPDYLLEQNRWDQYSLNQKPNIYLIFIESYGRVLFDNSQISSQIKQNLELANEKLKKHHWHPVSHLSIAPVSGGISWISYGSLIYGFNIKEQGHFLALLNNQDLHDYPNLFRFLRSQGYKNYRLSAIPENKTLVIPWEKYTRFFAVDQWIRFEDFNYTGKLWGFGPCPPDQYSLQFAQELISREKPEPYTLFFITQNSHSPFHAPEHPVADWKMLDDGSQEPRERSKFVNKPKILDYQKAITYQFEYLSDFIIDYGHSDDLFILVGDHQPPFFSTFEDGFETPVHIIGRDSVFIGGFTDYGFIRGMVPDTTQEPVRHEGFYSYFLREFIKANGQGPEPRPGFFPEGYKLKKNAE